MKTRSSQREASISDSSCVAFARTTSTVSGREVTDYPSPSQKGVLHLIVMLASLLLVACSHAPLVNKDATAEPPRNNETLQKTQQREPRPGDTRIVDGVEYVYGKNVRYMVSPGEPEYTWVRKDQYFPDGSSSSRGRAAAPARDQKELATRIARLEAELKGGDAPQPASPAEPVPKSSAGDGPAQEWTSYAKGNGIEYFYDKDTVTHPSKDMVQLWRKREFPPSAAQKEIVTLDQLDCRQAQYRSVELRVTYRDGTTRAFQKVSPWAKIYEDSVEDYLMGEYCK